MTRNPHENRRSTTGNHDILPAFQPSSAVLIPPHHPLLTWTFGRGSIIWRIWPAVALHTLFAAAIVTLTMRGILNLKIPAVMLTVLGVVIGFVISYRASSGYDRYWMGRTCWSEIIRNTRTMGRLVWFHVPLRLSPQAQAPAEAGSDRSKRPVGEMKKVMAEKKMALDIIEGYAVALKHHIRGELGIYYQDLYHLVKPLHDHSHSAADYNSLLARSSTLRTPRSARKRRTALASEHVTQAAEVISPTSDFQPEHFKDPVIPPITAYGTFDPSHIQPRPHTQRSSSNSSTSSSNEHLPLLASDQPTNNNSLISKVSGDLIPFSGFLDAIRDFFSTKERQPFPEFHQDATDSSHSRPRRGPVYSRLHTKHRSLATGEGQNIPVEILHHLSNWLSVLEERGTVPGTSMGQMIGALAAFEDNLTTLERILTTPLPFVYSVHIRTVWVYLFFLPFQLVGDYGWFTIPGVAMAAFIYLGFVAAGEEIEQPFGYDENDLDLDLFCHEIIHNDIKHLKTSPCANAYLGPEIENRRNVTHCQSLALVDLDNRHDGEE